MIRVPYYDNVRVEETMERDGVAVTVRGWTLTLEDYALALEAAGLVTELIREPKPDASADRFAKWQRVPLFMTLRAARR